MGIDWRVIGWLHMVFGYISGCWYGAVEVGLVFGDDVVVWRGGKLVISGQKLEKFYGMELPRVGAFTDFGGFRYRNPVQNYGENRKNQLNLEFWGLV